MSEYRKAITERIKESVNNWIETLKKEQPETKIKEIEFR